MTVFDILAKRNADKLRAVRADGASIRYHLRMDGSEVGAIDVFELFNGVSLAFNSIPQGTASWDDIEPLELQIDWCLRGRFQLNDGIHLGDGELAVHDERIRKRSMRFPAPLYTGFTIRISRSEGAEVLSRLLSFDFDALAQRLTGSSGCKIYAPDPSMKALLESFWDIDEREPLMRLRLKALELISLVNATPRLAPRAEDYLQRSTIESLERGMRLLGSNLEQNVAVADVAEASCMGISAFKKNSRRRSGLRRWHTAANAVWGAPPSFLSLPIKTYRTLHSPWDIATRANSPPLSRQPSDDRLQGTELQTAQVA